MIKYTDLKFPPIKPKALPDKLIYKTSYKNENGARIYRFTMFSPKQGEDGLTIMRCFPRNISVQGSSRLFPSLYISYLYSVEKGKGFGTKMLNFAKNFSKELGCGGNFHLAAGADMSPNHLPHIFYRKFGMTSNDLKIDKKLDKFVKRDKNATYKDFNSMPMYYFANRVPKREQIVPPKKQSVLKRFIDSIFR